MTARTQRIIASVCLVMSATLGILSLKRTMNLGMTAAAPILLVMGAVLMRKSRQNPTK